MTEPTTASPAQRSRALWLSTVAFTVCFAVWTIFSIIGVQIKDDLGLSDTQFGLLAGTPILTGSLTRLFLGIWSDQYGGRVVYFWTMIAAAIATFLLSYATTYEVMLLAALGVGVARGLAEPARHREHGGHVRDHPDDAPFGKAEVEGAVAPFREAALLPHQLAEQGAQFHPAGRPHAQVSMHREKVVAVFECPGRSHRNGLLAVAAEPLRNAPLPDEPQHLLLNDSRRKKRAVERLVIDVVDRMGESVGHCRRGGGWVGGDRE